MPSDGTLGYLVGKLDMLRIECPRCDRQGRYHEKRSSLRQESLRPSVMSPTSVALERPRKT